ncbi:hypothetical protein C8A00DRAFT_13848 [Chaetomidium leptoderma]|uniref:RING-CH-type domain-containing protein n=1 Tax=Chaetomidium leptoderma TaxID=669021 RepID=A0AAN6VNX4_9PEZI|nr:hypothetical protein C8A00DRAFT_13848 [Chaetomidium leptoderma]
MASDSFQPQWGWPSGMDAQDDEHRNDAPRPPATDEQPPGPAGAAGAASDASSPNPTPTPKQRHYQPRTCRICLEVVNPTTDIDDSLAGRVFSSKTRVRYVSEDPELGRLLSPCKCKGSQKYVHQGCLQAWRNAAPLSDRNYWRCPTCQFEYQLQRLRWSRWLSSKLLRGTLTVLIMVVTVFVLGFVADPIIGFWVDPFGSLAGTLMDLEFEEPIVVDDEAAGWAIHFVKGFLSLGLLGFLKTMFVMSPWHWFNVRVGGGGRRRRGTGRDRMEQVNWALVVIGVLTFLGATWKFVNHLMAKTLEKASDHVLDVQEDNPDEDEEDNGPEPETTADESRKDK